MLPPHERLDAEYFHRLQVDLRLVVHAQLVARDGVPEISHQREPFRTVAVELLCIHDGAGAILLGHIHRDVRPLNQNFGFRAVLGKQRDADAAVHVQVQAFNAERLLHHGNQFARGELRARTADIGQQHRELVAAKPRHGVGLAQARQQAPADLAQHGVAHQVAQRVVDLLEPVEIHDQDRQRASRAQRVRHGLLEPVLKQRAVGKVGKGVVIREMADALFCARTLAAYFGIAQLTIDRGNQPVQVVLDDVVVGAVLHRFHGHVFTDRA